MGCGGEASWCAIIIFDFGTALSGLFDSLPKTGKRIQVVFRPERVEQAFHAPIPAKGGGEPIGNQVCFLYKGIKKTRSIRLHESCVHYPCSGRTCFLIIILPLIY